MLDDRLQKLEQRFRTMSFYAMTLTLVLVVMGISAFRRSAVPKVLRAQGLIIEDGKGRERILIGAPIPFAKSRVRTDLKRVEKEWASRYGKPAQYMEYYKNYRHAVNGMVVLSEEGFDRLAIGDSVPDPNIGRRIGHETGLLINNAIGEERSGYGLLDVKGIYRVVLGLDSKHGQEGLYLMLDDAGLVQMGVQDGEKSAILGTVSDSAGMPPSFGLVVRQGKATKHQLTTKQP